MDRNYGVCVKLKGIGMWIDGNSKERRNGEACFMRKSRIEPSCIL